MGKGEGVREVQTSGAAAAAGGRHAEAEAAAAGVGHALADVARAARATGHAIAELRHVEDVHLIFFGVGHPLALASFLNFLITAKRVVPRGHAGRGCAVQKPSKRAHKSAETK